MKRFAKGICLLMSLLLLFGCARPESVTSEITAPESSGAAVDSGQAAPQKAEKTEQALAQIRTLGDSSDDSYRIWYEIFVSSYCDSDGDGIGDLNGVRSKLDELEQPGEKACPYVDYYNFTRAESCPTGFTQVPGADGWFYESRFSPEMPDLNLGRQQVREEIRSTMEFWLQRGAALPVIARGTPTAETALNQSGVSAVRKTWEQDECIILMNVDEKTAEADLSGYPEWSFAAALSADGNLVEQAGETLTLPPFAVAILTPDRSQK